MLQFITNPDCATPVAEQVKQFISGGGRWVQVRMPEASDEEIAKVIEDIKPLCLETETFLLLTDRVELAKKLDVGGVHLSRNAMLPSKARMLLGPAAVIGVSAHTLDDVKAVRSLDVDYIALEPFADTRHKKEDEEPLGIEGLRAISNDMLQLEIDIAHVAMGGVKLEDVPQIMEAGINGIAVSDAIACAPDIEVAAGEFLKALRPFFP